MEEKLTVIEAIEKVKEHLTEQVKIDNTPRGKGGGAFLVALRYGELKHERPKILDYLTNAIVELKVVEEKVSSPVVNEDDDLNAEDILNKVFEADGIKKGWLPESKRAVLKAMHQFASVRKRENLINGLAEIYALGIDEAATVTEICDEVLDKSGALLGEVRFVVRKLKGIT